jgi:hypothetical protein
MMRSTTRSLATVEVHASTWPVILMRRPAATGTVTDRLVRSVALVMLP